MISERDSFDQQVRSYIYDVLFTQGTVPTAATVAAGLACPPGDVVAAFQRLAQGHVIVLQRDSDEILMANPFSAVPTPFQVEVDGRSYWGNCIWDALGVLAMLKRDGRILASCGDCNASMTLLVSNGVVVDAPGVAHFSVPSKQWWDNIVFT
ncbi:MAG: organomercurial lyase [Ktedonobacterales bacterium]